MSRRPRPSAAAPGKDAKGVSERLVYTNTVDGLTLRGALLRQAVPQTDAKPLVIWVHTRQQNFSEPEYIGIGHLVARNGCDFLSVDTRGHDFGSWYRTSDGPILIGSAWERFSDCVHDLDAWVDFAANAGYRHIILSGHGFGGAKVLHFAAQRQRPEIVAVALASSGAAARDKFTDETHQLAHEMVETGRGRDLMPWGTGGDTYDSTVSADWYLARAKMHEELYGTDSLPPAVARIRVPIIAWYGTKERRKNREVDDLLAWLKANAVQSPQFIGRILPDLGFFYAGRENVVAEMLLDGLRGLGLVTDSNDIRSVEAAK